MVGVGGFAFPGDPCCSLLGGDYKRATQGAAVVTGRTPSRMRVFLLLSCVHKSRLFPSKRQLGLLKPAFLNYEEVTRVNSSWDISEGCWAGENFPVVGEQDCHHVRMTERGRRKGKDGVRSREGFAHRESTHSNRWKKSQSQKPERKRQIWTSEDSGSAWATALQGWGDSGE